MDLLDTQREEIYITPENFELAPMDLREINSQLNHLSDLCPMGSDLNLKMAKSTDCYQLNLEVKNIRVSFNSLQSNQVLIDAFSLAYKDINEQILNWKKNRFKNDDADQSKEKILAIDSDGLE